jgi:hypothetical protein
MIRSEVLLPSEHASLLLPSEHASLSKFERRALTHTWMGTTHIHDHYLATTTANILSENTTISYILSHRPKEPYSTFPNIHQAITDIRRRI